MVGRVRSLDLAPITGLMVLVLAPAIIFDSLARAALPRDLLARLLLHAPDGGAVSRTSAQSHPAKSS